MSHNSSTEIKYKRYNIVHESKKGWQCTHTHTYICIHTHVYIHICVNACMKLCYRPLKWLETPWLQRMLICRISNELGSAVIMTCTRWEQLQLNSWNEKTRMTRMAVSRKFSSQTDSANSILRYPLKCADVEPCSPYRQDAFARQQRLRDMQSYVKQMEELWTKQNPRMHFANWSAQISQPQTSQGNKWRLKVLLAVPWRYFATLRFSALVWTLSLALQEDDHKTRVTQCQESIKHLESKQR